MRIIVALALIAGSLAAQTRRLNTSELQPLEGWAELEWVSTSTFRYARTWSAAPRSSRPLSEAVVDVTTEDLGPRIRFKTRFLTVEADKGGGRINVRSTEGPLTTISFSHADAAVKVDSTAVASERFYGLGSRGSASLNLRGSVVDTRKAFLISSAGYGECFRVPGTYRFDLGASQPDTRRVTFPGDRVEYLFYFGPTPKEILEAHFVATGESGDFGTKELAVRKVPAPSAEASWADLRNAVYSLQHESMSSMLVPSFHLGAYQRAGGDLAERAAQLAAFLPLVTVAETDENCRRMLSRRTRLIPYMLAYGYETRTRGVPLIHPLAMQFPRDAEAWKHTDELMVGDEMLIAPVLGPVDSVRVYFPQGIWTDLRTNEVYKGRQEVTVRTVPGDMPTFSRNGAILPVALEIVGGPMELHYFPSLGGEFFLFEEDLGDISQVHAAPAGEFMRLESESLKDRTYEWVIHHSRPCRKVELGSKQFVKVTERERLAPGTWFFDEKSGNLHVRVLSAAGGDEIVNISF